MPGLTAGVRDALLSRLLRAQELPVTVMVSAPFPVLSDTGAEGVVAAFLGEI